MAEVIEPYLPYIIGGGVVTATIILIHKIRKPKKKRIWPRDKVIFHGIYRGSWCPSSSPFSMKLETYLRMAKIPYLVHHSYEMSKKNKTPWISYNDEDVADSQFCIEYLNEKFGVDLNAHLNDEERAIGRAFQKMLEENTYWAAVVERWNVFPEKTREYFGPMLSRFVFGMLKKSFSKQAQSVGMGRHTPEEIASIQDQDLKALSVFLGKKKFLLGDKPSEFDASIFGFIAFYKYLFVSEVQNQKIKEQYQNLFDYVERVKELYWPDWDNLHTHGHTKETVEETIK